MSTAKDSFVSSMHVAVVIAMVVLLCAAAIVWKFLPHRAHDYDDGLTVPANVGPVDVLPPELAEITDS